MARSVKSRVSKSVKQKVVKVHSKVVAAGTKVIAAAAKKTAKVSAKAKAVVEIQSDKKKVSQRLLETIQKRRQAKEGSPFAKNANGKVPGRRGRRPKNVEYTPNNNEEEGYVLESEYERLEYDTGIRLKEASDDKGFNLDRFEDFDEELNFDW